MTPMPQTLDPVEFMKVLWPNEQLYERQKEMVYAVRDSVETYVAAGNKLGGGPRS